MKPLISLSLILSLSLHAPLSGQTPGPANLSGVPVSNQKPMALSVSDKNIVNVSAESVYLLLSLVDWQANTRISGEGTLEYAKSASNIFNAFWMDLGDFCGSNGLPVPVALSGGNKAKLERLRKEKGPRYDQGLLEWISKESRRLSTRLATAEKTAWDPKLKELAQKWAPVVKSQSEAAEKAEKLAEKAK